MVGKNSLEGRLTAMVSWKKLSQSMAKPFLSHPNGRPMPIGSLGKRRTTLSLWKSMQPPPKKGRQREASMNTSRRKDTASIVTCKVIWRKIVQRRIKPSKANPSRQRQKTEEALIDSGATECFLDHRTVSWLWLPPEPLKVPRTIHNIDGTHNQAGHITYKCRLKVQLGTIHQEMDFFITNLGQDRIILGYPFLKLFNPDINWAKGNLTQTSTVSITPVHLWKHCQLVWKEDRIFCIQKNTFAQQ